MKCAPQGLGRSFRLEPSVCVCEQNREHETVLRWGLITGGRRIGVSGCGMVARLIFFSFLALAVQAYHTPLLQGQSVLRTPQSLYDHQPYYY